MVMTCSTANGLGAGCVPWTLLPVCAGNVGEARPLLRVVPVRRPGP